MDSMHSFWMIGNYWFLHSMNQTNLPEIPWNNMKKSLIAKNKSCCAWGNVLNLNDVITSTKTVTFDKQSSAYLDCNVIYKFPYLPVGINCSNICFTVIVLIKRKDGKLIQCLVSIPDITYISVWCLAYSECVRQAATGEAGEGYQVSATHSPHSLSCLSRCLGEATLTPRHGTAPDLSLWSLSNTTTSPSGILVRALPAPWAKGLPNTLTETYWGCVSWQ